MSEPMALPIIVVDDDETDGATMSIFGRGASELAVREVPLTVLRQNFARTVAALRTVLGDIVDQEGPLRLVEAEVGIEVSASGGIRLVGTAQAGIKSAITLKFAE
jgi:hypothetical protein